tara:strand:- start:2728 stop:2889 length:162 start_codon:yes stop_codon:yes gene_type:complete
MIEINKIEKAIKQLEDKIDKQGIIKNERDLNHLDNLQQIYISEIMKENRRSNK